MNVNKKRFFVGLGLLGAFIIWTILLLFLDVQEIGPQQSKVGLATINGFIHRLTGVHMSLYVVTDWLGLVPVAVGFGFAILGLAQWIKRRRLLKVDPNILLLGGFYIIVMTAYIFFEMVVINYRPVLINGYLEASYPSSTTMLVLCVMTTAIMQVNMGVTNKIARSCLVYTIILFMGFMVVGRLISGVHWISDIIGGGLFSAGVICLYASFLKPKNPSAETTK